MKVRIEVSSSLKRYTKGKTCYELDVEQGTKAIDAIKKLGIPEEEVGIISVNGVKAEEDYIINENDKINVFPVIIGG